MQKTCLCLGQTITLYMAALSLIHLAAKMVHKDHVVTTSQAIGQQLLTGVLAADDAFQGKLHDCQLICIGHFKLLHSTLAANNQ